MQESCVELRRQVKAAQADAAAARERGQAAQTARRGAAAEDQAKLQVRHCVSPGSPMHLACTLHGQGQAKLQPDTAVTTTATPVDFGALRGQSSMWLAVTLSVWQACLPAVDTLDVPQSLAV